MIPALIGAGATILGNMIGASSTNKTNRTNLKINHLNNAFNERMMDKQMDYNTMMWEKSNSYNTPVAMRQRGINPYASMMGGNFGSVQSQGVSAASAASAVPQQAFHPDFQGIPQSILMAEQGRKLRAETHQQLMDNQTRNLRNMQEIANIIADTKNKNVKFKLDSIFSNYADQVHLNQIAESRERQSQMKEQTRNIIREGLLLDKNLRIFDERARLEIAQMSADIILSHANMKFTKQQTLHEIQKMIQTTAQTRGIKISNDVARRTANSLVEKAKYDAYYQADNAFGLLQRIGQRVDNYFAK